MDLVELLLATSNRHWLEAAVEFNLANTDSEDVAIHTEMVMMKSAFERLLDINQTANAFCAALNTLIGSLVNDTVPSGNMTTRWQKASPRSTTLLEAWARDFCVAHGLAAHGVDRNLAPHVWSQQAHLAYASVLFPLLMKVVAAESQEYRLSDDDRRRLHYLESYLADTPFYAMSSVRETLEHPWRKIEERIRSRS